MKLLRQIGVIFLLLLSGVAPAAACMGPDVQMTVEEQACCRMMKSQCGQMEMPASHDCCKKSPTALHDNVLKTEAITFHPAVAVLFLVSYFELFPSRDVRNAWVDSPEYSPPKSPPASISILRV